MLIWQVLRDEGRCASWYPAHRPRLLSHGAREVGNDWTTGLRGGHALLACSLPASPTLATVRCGSEWDGS